MPLPPYAPLTLRVAGAAAWANARRRVALRSHAVADAVRIFVVFQALTLPATSVACRRWVHPHELPLPCWLPDWPCLTEPVKAVGAARPPPAATATLYAARCCRQEIAGVRDKRPHA